MTLIDTTEGITFFALLQMKGRLQMELKGITFRQSTLKPLNAHFGTKFRKKEDALEFITAHIAEIKAGK